MPRRVLGSRPVQQQQPSLLASRSTSIFITSLIRYRCVQTLQHISPINEQVSACYQTYSPVIKSTTPKQSLSPNIMVCLHTESTAFAQSGIISILRIRQRSIPPSPAFVSPASLMRSFLRHPQACEEGLLKSELTPIFLAPSVFRLFNCCGFLRLPLLLLLRPSSRRATFATNSTTTSRFINHINHRPYQINRNGWR